MYHKGPGFDLFFSRLIRIDCLTLFKLIFQKFRHCFADDTKLWLSFSPSNAINQLSCISAIESCVVAIRSWMLNDSLKLNDDKSGFLIIGTPQQVTLINIGSVRVGNCTVSTVTSARNLFVWLQAFDVYSYHKVVFYYLCSIRRIRKYLPRQPVYQNSCACVFYCWEWLWWQPLVMDFPITV